MDASKYHFLLKQNLITSDYRLTQISTQLRKRCDKFQDFVAKNLITKTFNNDDSPIWTTLAFEELPPWMQWNEFLHRGHRPETRSFFICLKSLFHLHTETFNIWSHLLASLAFFIVLIYNFTLSDLEMNLREKLAFSSFLIGCILCFGLSAVYHTVNCHSQTVCYTACICDYLGIVTIMLGTLYPTMFYLWWCRLELTILYSLMYTGIGIFFTVLIFGGFLYGEHGKVLRSMLGIAVGCSGFLVLFHDMYVSGFWYAIINYPIGRLVVACGICIVGIFFYSTRIPERLWPGRFDIWGHSHQLFHLFVVAACCLGYNCFLAIADFRAQTFNVMGCHKNYSFIW